MNRRTFLLLSLTGLAGATASACASWLPLSVATTATPTPLPGAPVAPRGYAAPGTRLGNENLNGFYVRYYRSFPAPDPGRWRLTITGLVDEPVTLTLDQIAAELPFVERSSRLKCVEGWSSRATWGGFTYPALAALVKPRPEALHVYFRSEDDYHESLPVAELTKAGALFATSLDGRPVGAKYGAPLRMILPWLYGYKGAKAVHTIEFRSAASVGYWPSVGPYTVDGAIRPGTDLPVDIGGGSRPAAGGEITDY
jgi:methionine sulfoxide reductase catalytic subunit